MTKVGILSDTHGELLPQVLRFLEPCQCLWHAGDLGGVPVLDREFGSIDYLIWFDFDQLPDKYVKHFNV